MNHENRKGEDCLPESFRLSAHASSGSKEARSLSAGAFSARNPATSSRKTITISFRADDCMPVSPFTSLSESDSVTTTGGGNIVHFCCSGNLSQPQPWLHSPTERLRSASDAQVIDDPTPGQRSPCILFPVLQPTLPRRRRPDSLDDSERIVSPSSRAHVRSESFTCSTPASYC